MQREAESWSRHAVSGIRLWGLALLAALLLAQAGARAQSICTPTQTVSAEPDANGRYTTTIACTDTAAAEGAADYRHLHYNQGAGTTDDPNPEDRDTSLPNNDPNNNVRLTIPRGLVFTATGGADMRILPIDGAIALWRGGAKTVDIEEGAVINLRRTPGAGGNYPTFGDVLQSLSAVYVESEAGPGGDITVRHDGVLNVNYRVHGGYAAYQSNTPSALMATVQNPHNDEIRRGGDILLEMGATGVIRQLAGTAGIGGVSGRNHSEDGGVTINLAEGSMIDITEGGGAPAVTGFIHGVDSNGDVIINAAGTIRTAVRTRTLHGRQGVGIRGQNDGMGVTRITSSGTIETLHAHAIYATHWSEPSTQRDDPNTEEIEGNLIDVTAGRVRTRGGTAIHVDTRGANAAGTVRVGEGATVRAEIDEGADAAYRSRFGANGDFYIHLNWVRGWRQVDTNNDGTNDALHPVIIGIHMRRTPGTEVSNGVVDRVIVHGTVETVGGQKDVDAAIFLDQRVIGNVEVGATGRVTSDSGLAIASGSAPPADPPEDYRPAAGGLTVGVAGSVTGDIRVRDDGALTAGVLQGGTITGDIQTMGAGALTATVSGTVTGNIQAMADGALTADVLRGGTLTGHIQTMGAGTLTAAVSGTVNGNIEGLGSGDHTVTVPVGGTVTGTVSLAGSMVTVGGTVGRITLDDDGTVMVTPTGQVTGVSAGSHGVSVGPGGTVENSGTIKGTTGIRAGAGSTIENHGTIEGTIGIEAGAGSTVVNSGTVRSTDGQSGIAINFLESGGNTLTRQRGDNIIGKIQGLGSADTVDLSDLAADEVGLLTFVDENERPVPLDILDIRPPRPGGVGRFIQVGNAVMGLDTTAFALTDDVLSDLTGSIHAAVLGTGLLAQAQDGGPAQGRVWATPFGGWREQTGNGGLADGTHTFGGGLVGAGWGTPTLSVGGFIGGSAGQLAVEDSRQNVDMQTVVGGAYAQQALKDVQLDARVLVGHVAHDATRRVNSGTAHGAYTAFLFSPEIGTALRVPVTPTLHAVPRLRVRYAGLFTESFRERAPVGNWDVGFAARSVQILEGRGEVSLPIALEAGGYVAPRLGVEGRWLLAGEMVKGTLTGGSFQVSAGGDTGVATGTLGLGLTLPVAAGTTLVGNFDGALTTEHAWRATGYLGLTYSF